MLFGLDHFKAVNDRYGHGKGDDVLAAVGAVAAETLRASDFVGRLGGEEFAAVLPDTDRGGGLEAAETLRAAIATISVPGIERHITASFGVAVMPDDAAEPSSCCAKPTARCTPPRTPAATASGRSARRSPHRTPSSSAEPQ